MFERDYSCAPEAFADSLERHAPTIAASHFASSHGVAMICASARFWQIQR